MIWIAYSSFSGMEVQAENWQAIDDLGRGIDHVR
jgi:hypothetical protein